MKILHLSKFFYPYLGGIENFILDLAKSLKEFPLKLTILAHQHKPLSTTRNEFIEDIKVIRAGTISNILYTPLSPSFIYNFLKLNSKFDIIHIHMPNPSAILAVMMAKPKAKVLIHWHADVVASEIDKKIKVFFPFYKPLQGFLIKRADKIIVTSEQYLKHSQPLSPVRKKCRVIPLGLDPSRLKSDEERVNKIKKNFGGEIVFSLGRLSYYKGFSYLIKAMKYVDAVLILGGEGKQKDKLKKLIESEGLKNKIFLVGKIDEKDLGSYYEACTLFCLPSIEKTEAFGMVLLEAMRFKRPLVTTNIDGSGISWVNQDGVTGITVAPKDSSALAKAINTIISNPYLAKKMGENAYKRFEQNFHINIIAEKIYSQYSELLDLGLRQSNFNGDPNDGH